MNDLTDPAKQKNDVDKLFDVLIHKLAEQYPIFAQVAEKLRRAKPIIASFSPSRKKLLVQKILMMMKANAGTPGFRANLPELGLSDRDGRLQKALKVEDIVLVDQSITGFYERRTKLWGSEQS